MCFTVDLVRGRAGNHDCDTPTLLADSSPYSPHIFNLLSLILTQVRCFCPVDDDDNTYGSN